MVVSLNEGIRCSVFGVRPHSRTPNTEPRIPTFLMACLPPLSGFDVAAQHVDERRKTVHIALPQIDAEPRWLPALPTLCAKLPQIHQPPVGPPIAAADER